MKKTYIIFFITLPLFLSPFSLLASDNKENGFTSYEAVETITGASTFGEATYLDTNKDDNAIGDGIVNITYELNYDIDLRTNDRASIHFSDDYITLTYGSGKNDYITSSYEDLLTSEYIVVTEMTDTLVIASGDVEMEPDWLITQYILDSNDSLIVTTSYHGAGGSQKNGSYIGEYNLTPIYVEVPPTPTSGYESINLTENETNFQILDGEFYFDLGNDENDNPWKVNEVYVIDENGTQLSTEYYSIEASLNPAKNQYGGIISFYDLDEGENYSGYEIVINTNYSGEQTNILINDFNIPTEARPTSGYETVDIVENSSDPTAITAEYSFDMGNDINNNPYISSGIIITDENGFELSSDKYTNKGETIAGGSIYQGIITINNLVLEHSYSNYKINLISTSPVDASIDVSEFTLHFDSITSTPTEGYEIVTPDQDDIEDSTATVDYSFDLGTNESGQYYLPEKNNEIKINDGMGNEVNESNYKNEGQVNVENETYFGELTFTELGIDQMYNSYEIELNTSETLTAIIDIDDFSPHITELDSYVTQGYEVAEGTQFEENSVSIDYSFNIGHDQEQDNYQLVTDNEITLCDKNGNPISNEYIYFSGTYSGENQDRYSGQLYISDLEPGKTYSNYSIRLNTLDETNKAVEPIDDFTIFCDEESSQIETVDVMEVYSDRAVIGYQLKLGRDIYGNIINDLTGDDIYITTNESGSETTLSSSKDLVIDDNIAYGTIHLNNLSEDYKYDSLTFHADINGDHLSRNVASFTTGSTGKVSPSFNFVGVNNITSTTSSINYSIDFGDDGTENSWTLSEIRLYDSNNQLVDTKNNGNYYGTFYIDDLEASQMFTNYYIEADFTSNSGDFLTWIGVENFTTLQGDISNQVENIEVDDTNHIGRVQGNVETNGSIVSKIEIIDQYGNVAAKQEYENDSSLKIPDQVSYDLIIQEFTFIDDYTIKIYGTTNDSPLDYSTSVPLTDPTMPDPITTDLSAYSTSTTWAWWLILSVIMLGVIIMTLSVIGISMLFKKRIK